MVHMKSCYTAFNFLPLIELILNHIGNFLQPDIFQSDPTNRMMRVVVVGELVLATLCMSAGHLSPNIVTEEVSVSCPLILSSRSKVSDPLPLPPLPPPPFQVKTRVVKTKYGKVQGFVSKVGMVISRNHPITITITAL